MPLFNWDESYSVGVDSIDLQHKNLFDMINNLHDNIHSIKNEPLAIKTTLDELISYIQYHFLHEEELLKKNNFPEFQVHSIEHEKLCGNLEEFIKK
ncbi:MAG: bacteriohemerythrin, partial [Leptospiraceae bacterium]|nr:bacteriohemerythrin [Leptospiraceae bacterium]